MIVYRTKYYSLPYQKIFVGGVFAGRVRAAAMEKMPEYLKKK